MPSAITGSPRLWASATVERTITSLPFSSVIVATKLRSILSASTGNRCSAVSDE